MEQVTARPQHVYIRLGNERRAQEYCRDLESVGYVKIGIADDGEVPEIVLADTRGASMARIAEIKRAHAKYESDLWKMWGDVLV